MPSINKYVLDAVCSLIYVDQPIGMGFFHNIDPQDDVHDEKRVAKACSSS